MTPLFSKLNLKDQGAIFVLGAPESFEPELEALQDVAVKRQIGKGDRIAFGLGFAITQQQLDEVSAALAAAAEGDAVVWVAYPKGSSKRYRCEFNRDSGWRVLGQAGFEPVRQVALDEDWSALRFRRLEFIKSLTRAPQRRLTRASGAPG